MKKKKEIEARLKEIREISKKIKKRKNFFFDNTFKVIQCF